MSGSLRWLWQEAEGKKRPGDQTEKSENLAWDLHEVSQRECEASSQNPGKILARSKSRPKSRPRYRRQEGQRSLPKFNRSSIPVRYFLSSFPLPPFLPSRLEPEGGIAFSAPFAWLRGLVSEQNPNEGKDLKVGLRDGSKAAGEMARTLVWLGGIVAQLQDRQRPRQDWTGRDNREPGIASKLLTQVSFSGRLRTF